MRFGEPEAVVRLLLTASSRPNQGAPSSHSACRMRDHVDRQSLQAGGAMFRSLAAGHQSSNADDQALPGHEAVRCHRSGLPLSNVEGRYLQPVGPESCPIGHGLLLPSQHRPACLLSLKVEVRGPSSCDRWSCQTHQGALEALTWVSNVSRPPGHRSTDVGHSQSRLSTVGHRRWTFRASVSNVRGGARMASTRESDAAKNIDVIRSLVPTIKVGEIQRLQQKDCGLSQRQLTQPIQKLNPLRRFRA